MLRTGFQEKVKGIEHRHFRDQVHGHFELCGFLRKNQSSLVIGKGVLLPVDEMLYGLDFQAVRQNPAAAVWGWAQTNNLWPQLDGTVVTVVRNVVQCGVNGHKCK